MSFAVNRVGLPATRVAVDIPAPANAVTAAAVETATALSNVDFILSSARVLSCFLQKPSTLTLSFDIMIIQLSLIERTITLTMDAMSPYGYIKTT